MAPTLITLLLTVFLIYQLSPRHRNHLHHHNHHSKQPVPSLDSDGEIDATSRSENERRFRNDGASVDHRTKLSSLPSSLFSSSSPNSTLSLSAKETNRMVKQFYDYLERFNKSYEGAAEYRHRYHNFVRSLRRQHGRVQKHQSSLKSRIWRSDISRLKGEKPPSSRSSSNESATYGVTQFSDLSPKEFRSQYLTLRLSKNLRRRKVHLLRRRTISPQDIRKYLRQRGFPLRWDWRDLNVVTPVKNQGICGACYATSVVAMLETMRSIRNRKLSEGLSVQQILDCKTRATGCNGGDPNDVLEWLNGSYVCHYHNFWYPNHCRWKKHKITTEKLYPNLYKQQGCIRRENDRATIEIKDYSCMYGLGELEILHYVHSLGPLTAAVDSSSWMDYVGGVIQHNCGRDLNHAVVIVGYDASGDVPRYIIKNSWGTEFGNGGYVYVRIGHGLCGIRAQLCGAYV